MDEKRTELVKNEAIKEMMNVSCYPVFLEKPEGTNHMRVPFSKLSTFGLALEPLVTAMQNITTEGGSGLYRVAVPEGGHLAMFKDGSGFLGTVMDGGNHIAGQARLSPVLCDPTLFLVAAALASIDKKLDDIQETQQEILNFLVQKEKSELRGNLKTLADILEKYKYNCNNAMFKNSNYIKVLDIEQEAEKQIDFHQEKIEAALAKKNFIHADRDVKKQMKKVQEGFQEYQIALYLYGFAAFLDVMLLENFDETYLTSMSRKIENYSFNYRELYTKSYDQIEAYSKTTVKSGVMRGLATASKKTGEGIAKIPVVNKGLLDEAMIGAGDRLKNWQEAKTDKKMRGLVGMQTSHVQPFIENINTVNRLYNQPTEMLFDGENLYIGLGSEDCTTD